MVCLRRFEVLQNNFVIDEKRKHDRLYPVAIEFKDLTVIVGKNGSGKSQFIKAIIGCTKGSKDYKVKVDADKGTHVLFFDEEDYKRRVQDPAPWDTHDYSNEYLRLMMSHWKSTGEGHLELMDSAIPTDNSKYRGYVFMYDEPDHNLDFKNQVKIFNRLKKLAKDNQVIVATHSPVIIAKAKEVFDMESKQWVNSKEYLGRYGIG